MSPRLLLVAVAAATVGLAVYGASQLGRRPADTDAPAAAEPPTKAAARDDRRGAASDDARDADRNADRDALAIALRNRLERALEAPEDEEPPLPPSESRIEAETSFEVVMEQLERFAEQDAPISRSRKARLYRAANDSFSALTNQLDPASKADMQLLEDAHVRMKAMLAELDIAPTRPSLTP